MSLTGAPLLISLSLTAVVAFGLTVGLRRLRLRMAAAALCLTFTTAAFGASENDQFGYDTSWSALWGGSGQQDLVTGLHVHLAPIAPTGGFAWPAVAEAEGKPGNRGLLLAVDFSGQRSGLDRSGYVYLPPQYRQPAFAHTSFPVLELIAGSPGAPPNWLRQLDVASVMDRLIQQRAVAPMVLVIPAPNGHLARSQECVDAVGGTRDDTYLSTDVHADVVASFRVASDRTGWGVAGYSTGGFCAANLLTRHPNIYSAAASMDGYFHAIQDNFTGDLYRGDVATRLANSPDWVWAHQPPQQQVHFLVMAGGDDLTATTAAVQFHDEMVSSPPVVRDGDSVEAVLHPRSKHSFTAWRADLPQVLTWCSQRLTGAH